MEIGAMIRCLSIDLARRKLTLLRLALT